MTDLNQPPRLNPPETPRGHKLLNTLRGHTGKITRLAWSPDGTCLASGAADGVSIWDAGSSERVTILKHVGNIAGLTWSPTGKMPASGS